MEYIPAKTIVTKVKAPANWFGNSSALRLT